MAGCQEVSVMKEVLEILESDARLSAGEIAIMLSMEEEEIQRVIKELEKKKVILKYMTLVNWEKAGEEKVLAMIEVRVTPQRDTGFDAVAERIYRFPQVRSMHLMSGAYDLAVFVEGQNMREVSHFVATKLATIEGVLSTTTHFVLRTYKQDGVILEDGEKDRRLAVSP
jgi:DNA-binding Lrp family transcriptional regulator